MNILFTPRAWDDYLHWQTYNKQILKKINILIKECTRDSYNGIGKPEGLKGELSGWWSRRIDSEHRLVYQVSEDELIIMSCRYHY